MTISLVVPLYNEEDSVRLFYDTVRSDEGLRNYRVEIVFINDGSSDKTASLVEDIALQDDNVVLVDFTRNFGKEPALLAGLNYATGDAVIPIDVDLQDPIDVIPEMLERWHQGADIVLARRTDRSSDSFFKRQSAKGFYWLHKLISRPSIEPDVGDFRLLSREVVNTIREMPERNLFMKGIFSWVGFNTSVVEFTRPARAAGAPKFNTWKLWNLALEGITSFSTVPVRIWSYIGFIIAIISFVYALFIVYTKLIYGNPVSGYASVMTAILFLGGIQLIGIGVLGEYIGRIYIESKKRPRYLVKRVINKHT